jgi:hypothetical protein
MNGGAVKVDAIIYCMEMCPFLHFGTYSTVYTQKNVMDGLNIVRIDSVE